MEENDKLYMPAGIKSKEEKFKGIGRDELIGIIKVGIIILILSILIGIWKSPPWGLLLFLVGIACDISIFVKNDNNINQVIWIKTIIKFNKSQKKYDYIYQDEWR